jgi:hypothetical protein
MRSRLGLVDQLGYGIDLELVGIMPQQTLFRLINKEQQQAGGVFGPEDIAMMTKAFDLLLEEFKLIDRTDPVVTMLAKLVIPLRAAFGRTVDEACASRGSVR